MTSVCALAHIAQNPSLCSTLKMTRYLIEMNEGSRSEVRSETEANLLKERFINPRRKVNFVLHFLSLSQRSRERGTSAHVVFVEKRRPVRLLRARHRQHQVKVNSWRVRSGGSSEVDEETRAAQARRLVWR